MEMTPNLITPKILELCSTVSPGQKPFYVTVKPLPNQEFNECFRIVPEHVTTHGGEQIIGWSIWKFIELMIIEAEFHAIWRSPGGELYDITPKETGDIKILFLPDPSRNHFCKVLP